MVKGKAKGNGLTSTTKPVKKDDTTSADAIIAATEPEKMEEEVPAVDNIGEDKTEEKVNEEKMEENNDNEATTEDGKELEKMEEDGKEEEIKGEDKKDEEKTAEGKKEEEKPAENKKENGKGEDKDEKTPAKRQRGKRLRKRKPKKAKQGDEVKPAENTDKPESSSKEKTTTKADSMGMIFMCSSKTKKDCFRHKVFGLPASKKDLVAKIYKGMRLFLFDIDSRQMYGIYRAAAPGGYNLEPEAFKSAYPAQVHFSIMEDCLPLAEEKFKAAIKENYYGKNKFNCQLTALQVKNLCKLFKATTAKGNKSKQVDKPRRREVRGDRDRDRRQGREPVRRYSFGGERRYPISSALLPPRQLSPLPPPRPLYVYDRPLEMDYYRRDAPFERHDRRFTELEPDRRFVDLGPDRRLLDLELSRRNDITYRTPYVYKEPPSYPESRYPSEPVYPVGPPAGYYQPPSHRY